jgi:hypothetical protein
VVQVLGGVVITLSVGALGAATLSDPGILLAGVNAVGLDRDQNRDEFNTNLESARRSFLTFLSLV